MLRSARSITLHGIVPCPRKEKSPYAEAAVTCSRRILIKHLCFRRPTLTVRVMGGCATCPGSENEHT